MIENNIRNAIFLCLNNMFTEKYSSHVGTFRAVNLKIGTACVATKHERQYFWSYLASDIKVPILSFMRIDYDVYYLACIQLFLCVIDM